jgi:hypothetical protein
VVGFFNCGVVFAVVIERITIVGTVYGFSDAKVINEIYCDNHHPQYSTVYPLKTIRTQIELEHGTEVWVDGVPEFCDEDDILDIETVEVDLDNMCADISQAINCGWIEIDLIANEKLRYAYYQTLQIYSNG